MITPAMENNKEFTTSKATGCVIPCWLCGAIIPVKYTKKNKAYLICDNCGIQTFLRYGKAEELLKAKIAQYQENETYIIEKCILLKE